MTLLPENYSPKWTAADYPANEGKPKHLLDWKPPRRVFPATDTEAHALRSLLDAFAPLPPYKDTSTTATGLESQAINAVALVEIPTPIPPGYIAFLENTAEQCTSPSTKHSREGMNRAKEWVQRIDTPERMFERLTAGYGISMMFGERFHQFIRNSHNWRGASGIMLDIDLFKDADHPDAPEPCASQAELFDRFPLIPRICRYLIPSASSLYEGRPFKGRGVLLFPEPITDQRVYRAVGDSLLADIDCIPANVTKNPVAVGFGNTHNAPQAYDNPTPDDARIQQIIERAKATVLQEAHEIRARKERQQDQSHHPSAHSTNGNGSRDRTGGIEGENISEFIWNCDAVSEMVKRGWLTKGKGNEYRWHQASSDRSCEIYDDGGTIKIFSGTMTDASPGHSTPVQAHRFYLYQLTGLDLHKDSDKPKCREHLFSLGYGTNPKATPKRRKPILTPQPMPPPTEGWKEQQDVIKKAFASEHDIILIKADAGVGKDYAKATYIVESDRHSDRFIEMVPRIELGDEKVQDFRTRQNMTDDYRDVYQWRSVFYNHDDSRPFHIRKTMIGDGLMCVQPGKFDALRQKGATPQAVLCPSCPIRDTCLGKGYLSQPKAAQEADYFLTAQDGFLFDKGLSGFAQRIIRDHDRKVTGIVDEVRAHELFSECTLSKAELQRMGETWKGTIADTFATDILSALELETQPNFTRIRELVLDLSSSQRKIIIEAFTKHRIEGRAFFEEEHKIHDDDLMLASGQFYPRDGVVVAIATSPEAMHTLNEMGIHSVFRKEISNHVLTLSYQQAIRFGFYRIPEGDDHRAIEGFPKLHANPQWTPLHQLQSLFEQYPRTDDTPIEYDGERLTFSLPPTTHPSIDKLIMMSATSETEIIRDKVFPDIAVQVIESEPARWEPGNAVFQVYTGKYPRASVLDSDNNLKGFGIHAWEAMIAEIERTPDKTHAVVTYQVLINNLELPAGTVSAHYGAAEGENEKYATAKVFWILFDPRLPPHEIERRARSFYGRDAEPLNYDYDDETRSYADNRLQEIADQHAVGELIQVVGRARLVRRKDITVVIMTGRELPGISGREETTIFDLEDLIIAGGLDKLTAQVHQREVQETELREAVATLIEAGASDNKICQTLSLHHIRLAQIKAEPLPGLDETRMSQSSQPAIGALIAGCGDVTNSILDQIRHGITRSKHIETALCTHAEINPAAVRQQLSRMVKSGKLIRKGRGAYALPNADCDFLP